MHIRTANGYWGVVSCAIGANKRQVTIKCNKWPVEADELLPNSSFRAKLSPNSYNGEQQYLAFDVEPADPQTFAIVQLVLRHDGSGKLKPMLKKILDTSANDPTTMDKIMALSATKGIAELCTLLRVQRPTAERFCNALEAVRPKIAFLASFPCIPAKYILLLSDSACAEVQSEPYSLCEHLAGQEPSKDLLMTADSIWKSKGGADTAPKRLMAYAANETFRESKELGHYWHVPASIASAALQAMVNSCWKSSALTQGSILDAMRADSEDASRPRFAWNDERTLVATARHAAIERRLASRLVKLAREAPPTPAALRLAEGLLGDEEASPKHQHLRAKLLALDAEQRKAVNTALSYPLSILTGGPGTGKSLVTSIITELIDATSDLKLAAPTGKAASRLEELCPGKTASTIHSTMGQLKARARSGERVVFPHLAIDEFGMTSPELLLELLETYDNAGPTPLRQLILVGDDAQLPSVDPGSTLRDLIQAGVLPHVQLETVHRQGEGSAIAKNAQRIFKGDPGVIFDRSDPAWTCDVSGDGNPVDKAVQRAKSMHDEGRECMVIAQTRTAVAALNTKLQAFKNPPEVYKREAEGPAGEKGALAPTWRVEDAVVATENVYEKHDRKSVRVAANGELGTIVDIRDDPQRKPQLVVKYAGGHTCLYPAKSHGLKHSYALTVHRCQGSESPHAIVVLDNCTKYQSRESLYTATTRAQLSVTTYGDRDKFLAAIKQTIRNTRRTKLSELLKRGFQKRMRDE